MEKSYVQSSGIRHMKPRKERQEEVPKEKTLQDQTEAHVRRGGALALALAISV